MRASLKNAKNVVYCLVAQYKNKYTDMLQPSVAECQGPKVKIENYIQELDNNKLYIQLEGGDIN